MGHERSCYAADEGPVGSFEVSHNRASNGKFHFYRWRAHIHIEWFVATACSPRAADTKTAPVYDKGLYVH